MFGAVMQDPKLLKPLLEMVLRVKIQRIEYPELQKTLNERYASKSIRLDVYVADEAGTVYNVEIQTSDKKHLPRRTRYYQGVIDLHILEKGEDYTALQRSFVIFICTYDPFGQGRWVYTFENLCREDPAIALGGRRDQDHSQHQGKRGRNQRGNEISASLYGGLRPG